MRTCGKSSISPHRLPFHTTGPGPGPSHPGSTLACSSVLTCLHGVYALVRRQLGFALFFVIVVAASMVASVLVDNTGFLGSPVVKANKWTILALMVTITGGHDSVVVIITRCIAATAEAPYMARFRVAIMSLK